MEIVYGKHAKFTNCKLTFDLRRTSLTEPLSNITMIGNFMYLKLRRYSVLKNKLLTKQMHNILGHARPIYITKHGL